MIATTPEIETLFVCDSSRSWDLVRVVEDVLGRVAESSPYLAFEIDSSQDPGVLRFRDRPHAEWSNIETRVPVLRAIIARVAYLSHLETACEFSPYFGHATVVRNSEFGPQKIQCEWMNHLGEFWLTLTRLPDPERNGHRGERPGV